VTDDGPLSVAFYREHWEPRFYAARASDPQPKGATVSVLWGGQVRRIQVSAERGEQFVRELESA
jgi:hypothetical protein